MKARISVNKLGEYLEATPTRRQRIVSDQKEPMTFITTRYSKAKEAAIDFFCNDFDDEILIRAIEELENTEVTTDFQENDAQNSILFLQHLLDYDISDRIDFKNLNISKYKGNNPKLKINEVEVSINPDLIVSGTVRNKKVKGAIKLHTSKSYSLSNESAKNIATLIHSFAESHLAKNGETADIKYCISLDVFANICETAPKSFRMRHKNIENACKEINLWWKNI